MRFAVRACDHTVWMPYAGWIAGLAFGLCSVAPGHLVAGGYNASCELHKDAATHVVVSVPDSETLVLDDGTTVRLIGALAPRPPGGTDVTAHWPPEGEATAVLDRLATGRTVSLARVQQGVDRYGRVLAHVFAVSPEGGATWLQGEMLAGGHARAYALPGLATCLDALVSAERQARRAQTGLWSSPVYAPHPADETGALVRLVNTFQLVEGRVRRVARARGRVYLNFGDNWRHDFTVSIGPEVLRAHRNWSRRLSALEGRRIISRGWITLRNGPMIELTDPDEIEIVHDENEAKPIP